MRITARVQQLVVSHDEVASVQGQGHGGLPSLDLLYPALVALGAGRHPQVRFRHHACPHHNRQSQWQASQTLRTLQVRLDLRSGPVVMSISCKYSSRFTPTAGGM